MSSTSLACTEAEYFTSVTFAREATAMTAHDDVFSPLVEVDFVRHLISERIA